MSANKHQHEHSNEHNESCNCGHDHTHETHEHHHDEGCDCAQCNSDHYVHVDTHDMSIIGSVRCRINEGQDKSVEIIESKLKEVARAIEEQHGIIGHIKGTVIFEDVGIMILLVDDEAPTIREIKSNTSSIECVVITFNIDPDVLRDIMKENFKKYLDQ